MFGLLLDGVSSKGFVLTPGLRPDELVALRSIPTPALANAIELFGVRPRTAGYMSGEVRCRFPEMGVMVGYAATAITTARSPEGRRVDPVEYWGHVREIPSPTIAVFHDQDCPVVGAQWGEVQANIHRALGCVGAITDGSVRDLDEVRELGFQLYSSGVSVSHAYIGYVDFGVPVEVAGLEVHPGDLLVADTHGVIEVPLDIVRDLPDAVQEVEAWERHMIDVCQSPEWSFDRMVEAYRRPKPEMRAPTDQDARVADAALGREPDDPNAR